jgi:hypothetical protein
MLDTILEVSFTADQKHLLAAGGDQALRMWDITSGRVRHTLTGHTGKVHSTPTALLPNPPNVESLLTYPQALFSEESHCEMDILLKESDVSVSQRAFPSYPYKPCRIGLS